MVAPQGSETSSASVPSKSLTTRSSAVTTGASDAARPVGRPWRGPRRQPLAASLIDPRLRSQRRLLPRTDSFATPAAAATHQPGRHGRHEEHDGRHDEELPEDRGGLARRPSARARRARAGRRAARPPARAAGCCRGRPGRSMATETASMRVVAKAVRMAMPRPCRPCAPRSPCRWPCRRRPDRLPRRPLSCAASRSARSPGRRATRRPPAARRSVSMRTVERASRPTMLVPRPTSVTSVPSRRRTAKPDDEGAERHGQGHRAEHACPAPRARRSGRGR